MILSINGRPQANTPPKDFIQVSARRRRLVLAIILLSPERSAGKPASTEYSKRSEMAQVFFNKVMNKLM